MTTRQYKAAVHFGYKPGRVNLHIGTQTEELPQATGLAALNSMDKGWFFDPARGGITWLKTGALTAGQWSGELFCLELTDFSVVNTDAKTPETAGLNVFPSPASGVLTVETETGALIQRVDVRDTLGRLVKSMETAPAEMITVDLAGLSPGLYTLSVMTDRGVLVKAVVLE
jgi:hypothetical protein